jgi:hypothetical protein
VLKVALAPGSTSLLFRPALPHKLSPVLLVPRDSIPGDRFVSRLSSSRRAAVPRVDVHAGSPGCFADQPRVNAGCASCPCLRAISNHPARFAVAHPLAALTLLFQCRQHDAHARTTASPYLTIRVQKHYRQSNHVSSCRKPPELALLAQERSWKRRAPGKEHCADRIFAPLYAQNQGTDSVNDDDFADATTAIR